MCIYMCICMCICLCIRRCVYMDVCPSGTYVAAPGHCQGRWKTVVPFWSGWWSLWSRSSWLGPGQLIVGPVVAVVCRVSFSASPFVPRNWCVARSTLQSLAGFTPVSGSGSRGLRQAPPLQEQWFQSPPWSPTPSSPPPAHPRVGAPRPRSCTANATRLRRLPVCNLAHKCCTEDSSDDSANAGGAEGGGGAEDEGSAVAWGRWGACKGQKEGQGGRISSGCNSSSST